MVSGDWHKGRGVWGQGVPWKTKAGSHSSQKKEEGRSERGNVWEFLFVCPGENLRSFPVLLSSLSSHLLLWFFLLITLSHEARLPSRTAPDLRHWLIYMSTGTNTTHNPTRVSCCVCVWPVSVTNFASYVFFWFVLFFAWPLSAAHSLSAFYCFFTCYLLFLSFLFGLIALNCTFSFPMYFAVLCLPSGQILKDQWESPFHHLQGTHLHVTAHSPPWHTHMHTRSHKHPNVDESAGKQAHAWASNPELAH